MEIDRKYWTGDKITVLRGDQVFCFGSNPEGRHGAGAAKTGVGFGARYGQGRGISGNSYGIITKNLKAGYVEEKTGIVYELEGYRSVSEEQIKANIKELYDFAREEKDREFFISYTYNTFDNGMPKRSLNGYTSLEMALMFIKGQEIPDNIVFHESYYFLYKLVKEDKDIDTILKYMKLEENRKLPTLNKEITPYLFYSANSPFSQHHPASFVIKGVTFTSTEQFMMYCKAKLFNDENAAIRILKVNEEGVVKDFLERKSPREVILTDSSLFTEWKNQQKRLKRLGRTVCNFDLDVWEKCREKYVLIGNVAKFKQNLYLQKQLLNTGDAPLAKDSTQWKGENLLGKILTNVREHIKATSFI